jgi:multiple sugar transport system substrate-binding protein
MARARFISFLVLATLLLTGQGCGGPSQAELEAVRPVTLTVWSVFNDEDSMRPLMDAYRRIHSNVSFKFKTLRFDEYEEELIRAFAEGEGPDIFSLHNTWIGEYEDLLTPLPDTLTIPYTEVKGTIKKETIITLREEPTISQRELKSEFIDIVSEDVIRDYQPDPKKPAESRIFALPLGVDTLALFYNKDLLNAAGIAEPPATWQEFNDQVKLLTRVNADGDIVQSGAGIGTSGNVERAVDILSVLMMQNGTTMTSDDRVQFAEPDRTTKEYLGLDAVRFYTDFANPVKEVYTWNDEQPDSFEAFVTGKTAFFFGYSYHLPLIKSRAPKLNFGTSALPQISEGRTVNFANYWVETVSKASQNSKWAWDFLQFAASEEQVMDYLDAAGKPTARRGLINEQIDDEDLFVFVSQLLTATSWYRGNDAQVMEEAMGDLINGFLEGLYDEQDLMEEAQSKVQQTY